MSVQRPHGVHVIRRKFPGWREGWFELSTGERSKREANRLEAPVLAAYRRGQFDILDALKHRDITLQELRTEHDEGGFPAVRDLIDRKRLSISATQHSLTKLRREFEERPPARRDGGPLGKRTLKDYAAHIRAFHAWATTVAGRQGTVADLTEEALHDYREYLTNTAPAGCRKVVPGQRRATANRRINSIGKFCSWLVGKGLLQHNPVRSVRLSTAAENRDRHADHRYLDTPDVHAVLAAAHEEDRANPPTAHGPQPSALWLEVLLATGATTYTEGGTITLKRIRFGRVVHGMVELYLHGTKSQYRKRWVWIPADLATRIRRYAATHKLSVDTPLFPWDRYAGRHYWRRVIARVVANGYPELAGHVTYDLRHTFAVHAVRGDPENSLPGVDLVTLMKLMGHNRLETTQIYARHRAEDAPRALAVAAGVMGVMGRPERSSPHRATPKRSGKTK